MANSLPLPNDLQHLVEKRSGQDRRATDTSDVSDTDGAQASLSQGSETDGTDRRASRQDERRQGDRRS